tara:strand:- start:1245 stop:1688 length:444 start_codon:yes stop_codon:yes gene_type:complete
MEKATQELDLAFVESIAEDLIFEEKIDYFPGLWADLKSSRQQYLIELLRQARNSSEPMSYDNLYERMRSVGIVYLNDAEFEQDLNRLQDLEIVAQQRSAGQKGKVYELAIPLFGDWVGEYQDSNQLRMAAIRDEGEEAEEGEEGEEE